MQSTRPGASRLPKRRRRPKNKEQRLKCKGSAKELMNAIMETFTPTEEEDPDFKPCTAHHSSTSMAWLRWLRWLRSERANVYTSCSQETPIFSCKDSLTLNLRTTR